MNNDFIYVASIQSNKALQKTKCLAHVKVYRNQLGLNWGLII